MTTEQVAIFLAENPYVLALLAIVALWPVAKGIFSVIRRTLGWFYDRALPTASDVELGALYPSYVLAHAGLYIGVMVTTLWLVDFAQLLKDALPAGSPLRYIMWLYAYLLGLLNGALFGSLMAFFYLLRRTIKRKQSP